MDAQLCEYTKPIEPYTLNGGVVWNINCISINLILIQGNG